MAPIVITTPALGLTGGVSNYCRVLRPHLSAVLYSTVGARSGSEHGITLLSRLLRDFWRFLRNISDPRVSIVHINTSLGYKALLRDAIFVVASKVFSKQVILFIHGWDQDCEKFIIRHCPNLFSLVFFRAEGIIVLAQVFGDSLRQLGYRNRLFVETTAVDDSVFASRVHRSSAMQSHTEQGCSILFLARIEKPKGVFETIDAYTALKQKYQGISLTIAGDGPHMSDVRVHIARTLAKDIVLLGDVRGADKRRVFLAADLYLLPTYYGEGMATSVLEAMSYGLPVITRPVGGIADFFQDGTMGFLTESCDPAVLAALTERLIVDPTLRLHIGAFNRRYAREHFAASVVAQRIQRIYLAVGGSRVD